MIALLGKLFIRETAEPQRRTAYGVLCGAVGIVLNLLLFAGKLLAGQWTGSIAVTADAFNNLSDAGSALVTLLGFRIAARKPDPDHPFGHGRAEYIAGLVVAMLIILMGVELGQESVGKLLTPAPVTASPGATVILLLSIAVKLYMAYYNGALARQLHAPALRAAAADALSDSAATAVVVFSTLAGAYLPFPVDGWGGLFVAAFILRGGIAAARDTVDPLLGKPPTPEFVREVQTLVLSHPEILGLHDLVVHNYGPGRVMLSLHAEVSGRGELMELHDVIDNIEHQLQDTLGCQAVIHMDPVAVDDPQVSDLCRQVKAIARTIDPALSIHDFRTVPGPSHTNILFDVAAPYGFRLSDEALSAALGRQVEALGEGYRAVIQVDHAYT